jgi:hypothetical protein
MQKQTLILLIGAGALLAYLLSQRKEASAPIVLNTGTAQRPLLQQLFPSTKVGPQSQTDWAGVVTAGSTALQGIIGGVSSWFKKSGNSTTADPALKSYVDAPAISGTVEEDFGSVQGGMWA